MWFKKKSVLQAEGNYNSNTAVDNTDWRTADKSQTWTPSHTLPSAADANNYFYLPALGYYNSGQLYHVGHGGYYWSSSAHPKSTYDMYAYSLSCYSGYVSVSHNNFRYRGLRVGGFE